MKILTLALSFFFLFLASSLFAQDIITLSSGYDIEAKVLEVGEKEIKYKKHSNPDGPTYSISKSKLFRIKFENGDLEVISSSPPTTARTVAPITPASDSPILEDYGGKSAFGIELGGGGLLGAIGRYELSPNIFLEAGLHYRPIILVDDYSDEISFKRSIMLAGGITYATSKKYKSFKRKIKFNGVFLKAGHGFSSFTENFVAVGWHHESFRLGRKLKSVQFELGPGLLSSPWVSDNEHYKYSDSVDRSSLMIYWKISWNFIK